MLATMLMVAATLSPQDVAQLAASYADAVASVHAAHLRRPTAKDEAELAARLPRTAAQQLERLLAADGPDAAAALLVAGRAALDLDRQDDFTAVRARLLALDTAAAAELGIALSRPRFVALGEGGMEPAGLAAVADAFDLALDGYEEVFGLTDFSKVPGKKLRLRVRRVERIDRPPHFAPQFPWHSEIDFPVVDAKGFASPTQDGKFLFYGLCHELGHVIAMWGDRQDEADRHAWAHYTGVVLVEHLAATKRGSPVLKQVRDQRWRSLEFERKQLAAKQVQPGGRDVDGVMARFVALHDAVGPKAIGEALNALDEAGRHLRVNRVRYYSMRDFEQALLATKAGKKAKPAIAAAFAD
jgi:hypothetical protein